MKKIKNKSLVNSTNQTSQEKNETGFQTNNVNNIVYYEHIDFISISKILKSNKNTLKLDSKFDDGIYGFIPETGSFIYKKSYIMNVFIEDIYERGIDDIFGDFQGLLEHSLIVTRDLIDSFIDTGFILPTMFEECPNLKCLNY